MFSITGEQDHSPFGGQGVRLVWGQRPDGSHVHISEVPSGLKCDCVCPACELQLAAHKGQQLAHNFHHVNGQACAGARETNAHVWAKKILGERKEVWIPAGVATAGKERKRAFAAQLFKFDAARLEKREGSIVPDVVLTAGDRELIVEILVTHACDDVKIAKIREQGTSALEIDLSGLRHAESEEVVALALIGADEMRRSPRHWLFNTKVDQASERLAAEVARKETERKARLERAAEEHKAEVAREARAIIRNVASIKAVSTDATLDEMNVATSYELREHIGVKIEGRGFRVPSMLWLGAVLCRVVIDRAGGMAGILPLITPRVVIEAIYEDCLTRGVPSEPSEEVRAAVLTLEPGFVFPVDAIRQYLDYLEKSAILSRELAWNGKAHVLRGWQLARHTDERICEIARELGERQRREDRAKEALDFILERIPSDERDGFSLDRWIEQSIPDFGVRLADLVEVGGEGWRVFERAVSEIGRMFRDGPPAQQTLGLPIEGEVARATERERIKQEEAARFKREAEEKAGRDRAAWLTQDAIRALGPDRGAAWLAESVDGGTRLSLASASDSALGQAQLALGATARQQAEQDRRDREAEDCRGQLQEAALRAFDSQHAELFLRSTQPRLGMSPWSRCTDKRGLSECLALLPGKATQRASRAARW